MKKPQQRFVVGVLGGWSISPRATATTRVASRGPERETWYVNDSLDCFNTVGEFNGIRAEQEAIALAERLNGGKMTKPRLSGAGRRRKGVEGEREVRHAFEGAGFTVRGLENTGDHLVVCSGGLTLHIESKRHERLDMDRWSYQAEREAPQGTLPIVAYRRSREPWRASIRLDDLLAILVLANARSQPGRDSAASAPAPDEVTANGSDRPDRDSQPPEGHE